MAINKVVIDDEIKLDLTTTTATASDVMSGKTFVNSAGEVVEGEVAEPAIAYVSFNRGSTWEQPGTEIKVLSSPIFDGEKRVLKRIPSVKFGNTSALGDGAYRFYTYIPPCALPQGLSIAITFQVDNSSTETS